MRRIKCIACCLEKGISRWTPNTAKKFQLVNTKMTIKIVLALPISTRSLKFTTKPCKYTCMAIPELMLLSVTGAVQAPKDSQIPRLMLYL